MKIALVNQIKANLDHYSASNSSQVDCSKSGQVVQEGVVICHTLLLS